MNKCIQNPTISTWLWLSVPLLCLTYTLYTSYKDKNKVSSGDGFAGLGDVLLFLIAIIFIYICKFWFFKKMWNCVKTNILIVLIILFVINIIWSCYKYYMYKKSEAEYIVKLNKIDNLKNSR